MSGSQHDRPKITLDDIDSAIPLVAEKRSPNARDLLEQENLLSKKLENKLAKSKIKDRRAERRLRNTYANRILRYLEAYSAIVGLMVLFQAAAPDRFQLANEIIAVLVGSTAVAAIGLVGFVAKGLFRPGKDE